jgi:hypothetical protein
MLGLGTVLDKAQEEMRGSRERLDLLKCDSSVNKICGKRTNTVD